MNVSLTKLSRFCRDEPLQALFELVHDEISAAIQ
jgi:hypothetical protein